MGAPHAAVLCAIIVFSSMCVRIRGAPLRSNSWIFKGSWKSDGVAPAEPHLYNMFMIPGHSKGTSVYSLTRLHTASAMLNDTQLQRVTGSAVFRFGHYSNDDNIKYSLQGLYFVEEQTLVALANPRQHVIVSDLEMDVQVNTSSSAFLVLVRSAYAAANETRGSYVVSGLLSNTSSLVWWSPNNSSALVHARLLQAEHHFAAARSYVGVALLSSVVNTLALLREMPRLEGSARAMRAHSVVSVAMLTATEAYLSIFHFICAGIVFDTSSYRVFLLLGFTQFASFTLFYSRYFLMVCRYSISNANSFWSLFGIIYVRFYTGLTACCFLFYLAATEAFYFLLLPCFCWWLPQITSNIKYGTTCGLSARHVIVTSLSRMLVLYFIAGENFLHARPSVLTALLCIGLLLAQIVVLLGQERGWLSFGNGSSFKYRFESNGGTDCVVCMDDVLGPAMKTPCQHVFHIHCLERWMDEKMECPMCRAPLPFAQ